MSSEAMNRRASSSSSTVRPNGPVLVHRSLHSDQYKYLDTIVLPGRAQPRDRRTRTVTIKGVASVPAFGEQPPAAVTETLDALDDRIAHAGHARPPGRKLSRRGAGRMNPLTARTHGETNAG